MPGGMQAEPSDGPGFKRPPNISRAKSAQLAGSPGSGSSTPRRSTIFGSGTLPPGVMEDEIGTEIEREKNRKLLRELNDKFVDFQQATRSEVESLRRSNEYLQRTLSTAKAELMEVSSSGKRAHQRADDELMKLRLKNEEITRGLNVQQFEAQSIRAQIEKQIDSNIGDLTARSSMVASELDTVKRSNSKLVGELTQVKNDCRTLQREIRGTSEHSKKHAGEIQELRQATQSKHEIVRIEAKSDLAQREIRSLRAQLWERGVLNPVRPEPEIIEEERPPVGSLELGEDIFTARLLLRLGFLKGHSEMTEDSSLLSENDSNRKGGLATDSVTGIVTPDIEEGTTGYYKVACGWTSICFMTFCIQMLVLLIMFKNGMDMSDGSCYKEVPHWINWWLLHLSKALAMVVAGVLLGSHLMDIVNYWMVAELLFPVRDVETTVTALGRVTMTFLIVGANIAIFFYLRNPANVWLNMTALHFISSLGVDVLGVAKRGVFGHHISKVITDLNFQLFFVDVYPRWFKYVRAVTVSLSATVVTLFATLTFFAKDNMCELD